MKIHNLFVLSALSIFVLPLSGFASVKINEVAWMGNASSQYGEWIELYNGGSTLVDLKDAALYEAGGGTLIIKLTKTIDPGGYYLIARSTPSVPDPVSGLADDLGSFGGSGLSNSGESLVLKSAAGDLLDSLDASSGWPAGDASSKQTMQRVNDLGGVTWITATATQRAANATSAVQASSGTSNSTTTSQTSDNSSGVGSGSTTNPLDKESKTLSSHSSQSVLSETKEDVKIIASAGRDRLVMVDSPVAFESKLFTTKGDTIDGGNAEWSFGDGVSVSGKNVVHTYKFPGDYAVVMNITRAGEDLVARTNVRVINADISISDVAPDYIKIKNKSSYEVNLGGWQLTEGRSNFTFPRDTIVLSKQEIAVAKDVLGFTLSEEVKLVSPAKKTLSTFKMKKEEVIPISEIDRSMATTSAVDIKSGTVATLLSAKQKLLEAKELLVRREVESFSAQLPHGGGLAIDTKKDNSVLDVLPVTALETVEVIEKPKSFLKTVLDIPVSGFRFLRGLFF